MNGRTKSFSLCICLHNNANYEIEIQTVVYEAESTSSVKLDYVKNLPHPTALLRIQDSFQNFLDNFLQEI